jgi:hypothetical protein
MIYSFERGHIKRVLEIFVRDIYVNEDKIFLEPGRKESSGCVVDIYY